jgi:hypothetical protein
MRRIPIWLKCAVTALVMLWAGVYWRAHGPQNFLWFCDLANFAIVIALWLESPLLLSSQAVSVLLVQILWVADVAGRALLGSHPIGGTEYMFDPAVPLYLRLASCFHVVVPPLLVWGLWRLGYDRRAWLVQSGVAWVVLPLSFWLTPPTRNINWVFGPFGRPQELIEPELYLAALMLAYPLVLYLPTHLVLRRLFSATPEKGEWRRRS